MSVSSSPIESCVRLHGISMVTVVEVPLKDGAGLSVQVEISKEV